jgi:hypothetical protein
VCWKVKSSVIAMLKIWQISQVVGQAILWDLKQRRVTDGHVWRSEKCSAVAGGVNTCVHCTNACSTTIGGNNECSSAPYFLSLCGVLCPATAGDGGHISVLRIDVINKSPPPSIISSTATPSRTSVALSLKVSSPGFVYCAAFKASSTITTLNAIKRQNIMTSIVWRQSETAYGAIVTIPFLSPASSYDIYCATQSLDGDEMTLPAVIISKKTVQTLCCKQVSVGVILPAVQSNTQLKPVVQIKLESSPLIDLIVFLSCRYRKANSTSFKSEKYPFVSTSIELIATSSTLSYNIDMTTAEAGDYELAFALSGQSASEYSISYSLGTVITVIASGAEPPPPSLESVMFSNNGATILVSFTMSTDRAQLAAIFTCSDLFSFAQASKTRCQCASDSRAVVYLGAGSGLNVGDLVLLNPAKLKAKCDTSFTAAECTKWKYANATSLSISAPLAP